MKFGIAGMVSVLCIPELEREQTIPLFARTLYHGTMEEASYFFRRSGQSTDTDFLLSTAISQCVWYSWRWTDVH